jgi:hypothetical protein
MFSNKRRAIEGNYLISNSSPHLDVGRGSHLYLMNRADVNKKENREKSMRPRWLFEKINNIDKTDILGASE